VPRNLQTAFCFILFHLQLRAASAAVREYKQNFIFYRGGSSIGTETTALPSPNWLLFRPTLYNPAHATCRNKFFLHFSFKFRQFCGLHALQSKQTSSAYRCAVKKIKYLPKQKAFLHFIQISTTPMWSARFAVKANKLERHIGVTSKKEKRLSCLALRIGSLVCIFSSPRARHCLLSSDCFARNEFSITSATSQSLF